MVETPVLIVVDSSADLRHVEAACALHGWKQTSALDGLYLLRGLIDPNRIPELTKIPGVRSIERERYFQFPPPNSRLR
jgi:hypothetical protein